MRIPLLVLLFLPLLLTMLAPGARAATVWDESLNGDLSSSESAPTPISLGIGLHSITGSVSAGAGDTRDFLSFAIAEGQSLAGLLLQTWEDGTVGGPANRGFHAMNFGATSFVPSATTIGSFLGSAHLDFVPAGTDLLPTLALAATGGTGFSTPLGPGTYSYLVQQTGPQINRYAIDFVVTPEPSAALSIGSGLVGLSIWRRRGR